MIFTKGDTPTFTDTFTDEAGAPVVLTGTTVKFRFQLVSSATVVEKNATVVDALLGKVSVALAAGDTDVVGEYRASWLVATVSPATARTFPSVGYIYYTVASALPASTGSYAIARLLEKRAGVAASEEYDSEFLNSLVVEALLEHNSAYTFTTLPAAESPLVLLLAWVKLCHARAAKTAQDSNLTGLGPTGFGQDRSTPYHKNMDLAKNLQAEYERKCALLGIDPAPSSPMVKVSTLRVLNGIMPGVAPASEGAVPPVPVLSVVTSGADLIATWTFDDFDDFESFYLFTSLTSMVATWALHESSRVPGVLTEATLVATSPNRDARSTKLTGANLTVDNRFLIAVKSASGKYSLSNEVTVVGVP